MCVAQSGISYLHQKGFHSPGQHPFHRGLAGGRGTAASSCSGLTHPLPLSPLAVPGLSVSPAHPEHQDSRLGTESRQHSVVTAHLGHAHRLDTRVPSSPPPESLCDSSPPPSPSPKATAVLTSSIIVQSCTQWPTPICSFAFVVSVAYGQPA